MKPRDDDGFAFLCAICNEFGVLLCCEQCKRGFHLACLKLQSVPETDRWLCDDCIDNKAQCFECSQYDSLTMEMSKCQHRNCGKFYHQKCVESWDKHRLQKTAGKRQHFVCPWHFCDACGSNENSTNRKLFRCLKCPVAYHENCCPDGASLLEDISGYLLCWKHEEDIKRETQQLEHIRDVESFFRRLPTPKVVTDFAIPRSLIEYVKKLNKKPPQYTHIRRNIYLVKKPKKRLEDEHMQCPCKTSPGLKELCGRDCLCGMLQTTCSSSCSCGDSCRNLPFQKRAGRRLQVMKTQKCGWGVRAAEDIKAGDFLIEYVGEVIDDKTCEERLWAMKKQGETNFYMCEITREMVIDATFKGNASRFINHSCCPNTELQKWQIDGEVRIGVFAVSDIKDGVAITYDYQYIQFGTDQECHCGSLSCRGKLGVKPSKQKLSAEAAMKFVTQEIMLSKTSKKSKLSSGYSVERGYTPISCFFRQEKVNFYKLATVGGKQLSVHQKKSMSCIGQRVRIWWPHDNKFYSGVIVGYNTNDRTHEIGYDDGQKESLSMDKETWEFEGPMALQRSQLLDEEITLPCERRLLLI